MKTVKLILLSVLLFASCTRADKDAMYFISIESKDNSKVLESNSAPIDAYNQMRIEMADLRNAVCEEWTETIHDNRAYVFDNKAKTLFNKRIYDVRAFEGRWKANFAKLAKEGNSTFDIEYEYNVYRIAYDGNTFKLDSYDFNFRFNN